MAVDVCSEIFSIGVMSPRISFSYDLNQTDDDDDDDDDGVVPINRIEYPISDFDFCISNNNFAQEPSSADEIFSNGKILPVDQIKRKDIKHSNHRHQSHLQPNENEKKKSLKEFLATSFEDEEEEENHKEVMPKSFWQFRRSSSLNCDNTRSKSLIRSLHFLSRSNSTGSAPNPKQTMISKNTQNQNQNQKQHQNSKKQGSVQCEKTYYYPYNRSYSSSSSRKPPLLKTTTNNHHQRSYYGNGVRISPVLNIPPPHYITKGGSVTLFRFGSIFCSGKNGKKKK